jgi:hypothetical protein
MEFAVNRLSHRRLMTPAIPMRSRSFFYVRFPIPSGLLLPPPGAGWTGFDSVLHLRLFGRPPDRDGGEEAPGLADACGPCNIPPELSPTRRPCLFLVPVRLWEGDALRTGFSCRWFCSLKPESLPGEAWQVCLGCPHWFPRPEEENDVPRMDRWIRTILRMYWEPEPPGESIWSVRLADTPTSWCERVMTRIREIAGILFPADGVTRRFRKGRGAQ